ncbi:MAG: hypothetical protein V3573_07745 [Desulfovibrionaceae bacterium]
MCAMTIDSNYSSYGLTNSSLYNSSTTGNRSSSSGLSSTNTKELRAVIDKLLADVPKGEDGKLSFQDVLDYRDKLREEFEAKAKEDLEALGVDTDLDFTLSYDADSNKVTVDSGHPQKKIIDKYFEDNEDMRDSFAKIVTLSKLTQAAETKLSPTDYKRQLQQQALEWWAQDSGGLDWFASGGMLMRSNGLSLLSGVNLKV